MGANVYKDKNTGRYYIKNYVNGVNHTIRRDANGNFFLTKKSAVLYMSTKLYVKKTTMNENIKLNNIYPLFLNANKVRLKSSTIEGYRSVIVNHIKPYFNKFSVQNVTNNDLINFSSYISGIKGISLRRKKKIIACSKNIFNYINKLKTDTLDLTNLMVDVNLFEETKKLNYLDFDGYKLFKSQIDDPLYIYVFDMLFIYGLRISELRAIKVSDFDLKNNLIYITKQATTKNGRKGTLLNSLKTNSSNRTYPIVPVIKDDYLRLMKAHKYKNDDFILKSNLKGKKWKRGSCKIIGETTIRNHCNFYLKKAELEKIRIHDFRHSCAIFILKSGIDLGSLSNWLGHESTETTARYYLKFINKEKNNIANTIDALMSVKKNE